jgi:hypothetical protein
LTIIAQAKLKSLHEVVVRNRLEQLRKRQRDEALHAQEELLAGVVKSASKKAPDNILSSVQMDLEQTTEEVEAYDREMSPELLDIAKLNTDDRQIRVVNAEEDRRDLVCSLVMTNLFIDRDSSAINAVPSRHRVSYPKLRNKSSKSL